MRRFFHHYLTWECLPMYIPESGPIVDLDIMLGRYAEFLRSDVWFRKGLQRVTAEWPISCEQFLSNESMNRVAWLGQASMCIETGVPRKYRSGFMLLTVEEQRKANATAQETLTKWLKDYAKKNPTIHHGMGVQGLF